MWDAILKGVKGGGNDILVSSSDTCLDIYLLEVFKSLWIVRECNPVTVRGLRP